MPRRGPPQHDLSVPVDIAMPTEPNATTRAIRAPWMTWLVHALIDWIGDGAWLRRLRCEHRRFNYVGDTTWIRGHVGAKHVEDGHHVADLELRCENQHGETTTPATATVVLPTREAAIALPEPPAPTVGGVVAGRDRAVRRKLTAPAGRSIPGAKPRPERKIAC